MTIEPVAFEEVGVNRAVRENGGPAQLWLVWDIPRASCAQTSNSLAPGLRRRMWPANESET